MSISTTNPDMHAALVRLGFSTQAASDIIREQGIDTLEELRVLDDKEVECLCKVVRKPGGTSNAAGTAVSLRAEVNLKMAVYYLKYQERTSRPTDASNITLNNVRALRTHNQKEAERPNITIAGIHNTQSGKEHKGKYKKYITSHKKGGNEAAMDILQFPGMEDNVPRQKKGCNGY